MRFLLIIIFVYHIKFDQCLFTDLIDSSFSPSQTNYIDFRFLPRRSDRSWTDRKSHRNRKRYPEKGGKKQHKNDEKQNFVNYRLKEMENFHKKVRRSLKKIAKKENITNFNQVYEKIKNHTGNGFYAIVFNCSSPSIVESRSKIRSLPDNVIKNLKMNDKCNKNDNLWRYNGEDGYVTTYDISKKTLTDNVLPFETLILIFNQLDMCREFLIFIRHPVYFTKKYRKPSECQNKDSNGKSK